MSADQEPLIICPDGTIVDASNGNAPVGTAVGCGMPWTMKNNSVDPYSPSFDLPLSLRVNMKKLDDLQGAQRSCEGWFMDEMMKLRLASESGKSRPPRAQLTGVQKAFGNMMAISCFAAYRNGINVSSIAESATMAATMSVLSRDFRDQMLDKFDGLSDDVKISLKRRAVSRLESSQKATHKKVESFKERLSQGEELSDKEFAEYTDLSARDKKLTQCLNRDDPTRMLMSPRMAAMAQIGLDRKFYAEQIAGLQTQKGEDYFVEKSNEYRMNTRALMHFIAEDGISVSDFHKERRQVVGELMAYDPAFGAMYDELSTFEGNFAQPDVPTFDRRTGNLSWSGQFRNVDGQRMIKGSFHMCSLKDLANADKLRASSVNLMERSLKDPERRMEALTGYLMGSHASKAWDQSKSSDQAVIPTFMAGGSLAQREAIARSRVVAGRCAVFGMTDQDREMFLWSSLCEATDRRMSEDPSFAKDVTDRFGEQYKETFASLMGDPGRAFCESLMTTVKAENARADRMRAWRMPASTTSASSTHEVKPLEIEAGL